VEKRQEKNNPCQQKMAEKMRPDFLNATAATWSVRAGKNFDPWVISLHHVPLLPKPHTPTDNFPLGGHVPRLALPLLFMFTNFAC
jgi:hypothetical protein